MRRLLSPWWTVAVWARRPNSEENNTLPLARRTWEWRLALIAAHNQFAVATYAASVERAFQD
jgi:hypothetical protein